MSHHENSAPMPRKTNRTPYEIECEQSERDFADQLWFLSNPTRSYYARVAEPGEAPGRAIVCLRRNKWGEIYVRYLSINLNPTLEHTWGKRLLPGGDIGEEGSKSLFSIAVISTRTMAIGFERSFAGLPPDGLRNFGGRR